MNTKQILLGFLPWIAFSAISSRVGPGAVGMAALVGLVLAAFLVARSVSNGESVKLIEITGAATFAAMGAWALVDPASDSFLAFYGCGVAAMILAVMLALSLAATPFTEQYARGSVPQDYWNSPRFHEINRKLSAAWAGAAAVMAIGHLVSGVLAADAAEYTGYLVSRPGDLVLNWLLPGPLILLTVRYSRRVVEQTTGHAAQVTR